MQQCTRYPALLSSSEKFKNINITTKPAHSPHGVAFSAQTGKKDIHLGWEPLNTLSDRGTERQRRKKKTLCDH